MNNTQHRDETEFIYELLCSRSLYLLILLASFIVFIPFIENNPRWLNAMHSLIIVFSAYCIGVANPRFSVLAWILVVPACLETAYFFVTGFLVSNELILIIYIMVFDFLVIVVLLYYVLHTGKITLDQMICAVSVYLLIAFFWSSVYFLVEEISPNSFEIPGHDKHIWMDLLYFSFVTLTTLGYGDVQPVSSMARSMCILEAVTGVFYLTILIARLINVYDSGQSAK